MDGLWSREGGSRALSAQSSEAEPGSVVAHPLRRLLKSPHFHVESGLDRLVAVAVWGQWFSVQTVGSLKSKNLQLPTVVLSGVLVS